MSQQIEVTDISPIVKGKKVTINLDIGWKYNVIHIKRNFDAAEATNYALKINGKIRQELSSFADMEGVNTHYGRPQIAGVTTIFLNRPELSDSEDRNLTGLGTADVRSVQIEYVQAAGTVVLVPDIEVVAEVSTNENIGWITKFENSNIDLSKVGKNVVSKMPIGDGNVFSYFMQKPTNDITSIKLYRVVNGAKTTIIESTKEFLEVQQKQAPMKPRVPVSATQTALDFTTDGIPEEALQTEYVDIPDSGLTAVERIGLDITVGTAETLTVITESVGQFIDA